MTDYTTVLQKQVIKPTYITGKPEKNPMFVEKRVCQGSSGKICPDPVVEKISDTSLWQTIRKD